MKLKVAPPSELRRTSISPPCASTIRFEIESPIPMPPDLVVTNGWKSCAAISLEMPGPVSETSTRTLPSVVGAVRT